MKSIIKVKIKAIDYYSMNKISFVKTITCNDVNFIDRETKPIQISNIINGENFILEPRLITAKQQADDWFGNNSSLAVEIINDVHRELNCILDWEVISIKNTDDNNVSSKIDLNKSNPKAIANIKLTEQEKIKQVFDLIAIKNQTEFSQEFKDNFNHVYQEMKDKLNGLSLEKKISLTLAAMDVGTKAALNVYDIIHKIWNDDYKIGEGTSLDNDDKPKEIL